MNYSMRELIIINKDNRMLYHVLVIATVRINGSLA